MAKGSRDLLLEFWDSLHISGTVPNRNLKSDTNIDHEGTNDKNSKKGQMGPGRGHVTYF